jgi:YD repeat-containing protein
MATVWTEFHSDPWGRVSLTVNPDLSEVLTTYSSDSTGLLTTIEDENHHATTQRRHATGNPDNARLVAVTDAAGGTTSYTYNALGSLTKVTSPEGVERTWTYNAENRLVSQTQPESGTVTYGYDPVGNLTSQLDARAQATSYTYDGNNRLTHVVTVGDVMYSTTITYDAANNRRTMANGYVSTAFDYDAANRLTRRTDGVNNRTFVSAYAFDDNGNVLDVQYPSGNRVEYGYDTENRVTHVSDPARGLTFASAISYHPAGGLAGYTSGDGAPHTVTYDARQRPAQMAATGLANLPTLTYTYDDTGNVTGIADPRAGHSATFTYDSRDRLETAAGGGWGTLVYGYDAVGNRTSKTSNGATTIYGYAAQRLTATTGAETAAFGYDTNGNQTADPVATYTYTPANMLETATLGAGAVYTYRYDGDNQRALKFEGSTTTTYYLRGPGQVLSEFEEQGGQLRWTRDQVYLGAQLLAAARPPAGTTVLTIGKAGAGAGTVSSAPTGIDCGPTCGGATAAFAAGAVVSLSAAAASGWVFVGWSGEPDCADGVVTLTDAKTCVATFALTAPLFAKQSPMNGGTSVARRVTLQWAAVPNAAYMVCWDTVNNGVCDTAWQGNGAATSRVVAFPENATYFWQVKTYTGTEADDGTWWSVTVTGPPLFTKIAPANGASGLGSALTLQWTAVPGEGYWVCWDTIDNGTCDTTWSRNGAMTAKVVTGLMSATYYWPFDLGDPRALRAIPSDVAVAAESRGGRGRRRTAACWRTTGRGTTSRWARVWAAPLAGAWKSSAALR